MIMPSSIPPVGLNSPTLLKWLLKPETASSMSPNLVGENWSPTTVGLTSLSKAKMSSRCTSPRVKDEIDIKIYKNVSVTDAALDFNFVGNN